MATTSTPTADEEQIRAMVAARTAAMRDRDAERFVAHYAPRIVKFDLPPPLAYTRAEARDAQALGDWFASHPGGPIDYQIRDLRSPPTAMSRSATALTSSAAHCGSGARSGCARSTGNG